MIEMKDLPIHSGTVYFLLGMIHISFNSIMGWWSLALIPIWVVIGEIARFLEKKYRDKVKE